MQWTCQTCQTGASGTQQNAPTCRQCGQPMRPKSSRALGRFAAIILLVSLLLGAQGAAQVNRTSAALEWQKALHRLGESYIEDNRLQLELQKDWWRNPPIQTVSLSRLKLYDGLIEQKEEQIKLLKKLRSLDGGK